jgi:hypothetical protein
VVAVIPVDIDLRMTVQMGSFTLHATDQPLEQRDGAENYLAKILIPENAKPVFADEIWTLGVRRSVLFPDLANLALELSSDDRWAKRKKL